MANQTIFLDVAELRQLYINKKYTIDRLCKHFGVSRRTQSETQLLDRNKETINAN